MMGRMGLTAWNGVNGMLCLLILVLAGIALHSSGATLSDPEVDRYNLRIGTQTFSGLYHFTTNTLLVETAQAIQDMGSDVLKMYLAPNFPGKYGITLGPNITNLLTLARDEPSCRQVFNMPFRHYVAWTYPISYWWPFDGYSASERASEYREFYDLTCYFLTNFSGSGKTFYLGHWEGDGYLNVPVNGKDWATNPTPTMVQGFIDCLNNRQKAIDDAKHDTVFTNVNVFCYAEANRVRDAMNNGPTNNIRMINAVIPYVTNLDYVSYSSYDAMNLSSANLYATLDYMEAHLPTNKVGAIPGERIWIGEYGWGGSQTPAQQEPTTRAYIQRLLNYPSHALPFILFWEIYDNEGKYFCLIDSNNVKTASYDLHQRFYNDARLLTAQFKETNGRLPNDSEWVSLVSPILNQPLPAPVPMVFSNLTENLLNGTSARVSTSLSQNIYGDEEAGVWIFYGRQDGGANLGGWESSRFVGVNTHLNPTSFTATLSNLAPQTNYYFRFYASNSGGEAWSAASQFSTETLNPSAFKSRMKIMFNGYNRSETLLNFPALVNLSANLSGFSYSQFASPTGGDLRFADSSGLLLIPHEIDEWNTNGTSSVWVSVPQLSGTNSFVWAYWGNPAATNPPASSTNGSAWPDHQLVWHLKESGPPFADSTGQHPGVSSAGPASTTGLVGKGCAFNGTSQFLDAGPIALGDAFTLSAWSKIDPTATNIQMLWANKGGGWNANGFALFVDSYQTTDQMLRLESGDGVGGTAAASATGAVGFGQWHLITAAIDRSAGQAQLFIDGRNITQSGLAWTSFANTSDLNLGRTTNSGFYFKGTMDEARIESVTRSSNWIWASWMTVASNTTWTAYSEINPQPLLSLNAGVLTWPVDAGAFTLYTTTNLAAATIWIPVTNPLPVMSNGNWQVNLPVDGTAGRFFRLQE
jgi:hypothetical protein